MNYSGISQIDYACLEDMSSLFVVTLPRQSPRSNHKLGGYMGSYPPLGHDLPFAILFILESFY